MTKQILQITRANARRRWPWILLGIALLSVGGFRLAQYQADGPLTDLIPGGPLRAGDLVRDTRRAPDFEDGATIELQLNKPARSRYVGLIRNGDEMYIPCDLGFMWGRLDGMTRHVLHLVYRFKSWHLAVLEHDEVVIRHDGRRYERRAVRVTDEATLTRLRTHLERLAQAWVEPDTLGPAPTSGPRDIWFFRLDPRQ
ncbi:MAG: hypothetical protein AAF515_13215 [Pseudomonadota bacterium]